MGQRLLNPSEIEQGMPIRTITDGMMSWISQLSVLEVGSYALPGGWEKRSFEPDPRFNLKTMIVGGQNVSPKNSDVVNYYQHVATLHHERGGYTFVVFQETMDALYARQRDPVKFPSWLMKDPIKGTERRFYMAVVTCPPKASMSSIYDWLAPIEDAFADTGAETWMYDAIGYYLITKGIVTEQFVGK